MSDACYTARASTRNEVIKDMSKIKLTKNATGQYVHDDILIAINQVTKIFALLYNQSTSGPGMALLLDSTVGALTNKKLTGVFKIESVLKKSKDEAAAAGTNVEPKITLHSNVQDEADSENGFTQALIVSKEGDTKGMTKLVGRDTTDTLLRAADGTNYKGIDKYHLHDLITAAISGEDRPATTDVLDQLIKVLSFPFDFKKKVSANVETLRDKAAKIAIFGVAISEPHFSLIILANIKVAIQGGYGREFRPAIQNVQCA